MYFYKREDIKATSKYNDVVKEELSGDGYLDALLTGVPKNARNTYDYDHKNCLFQTGGRTEKRLCRCLTLYKTEKAECDKCVLKGNPFFAKKVLNANMIDFEIPVSKDGKDAVGEIDLLIEYESVLYCAEFKPIWNGESLLRMVAEILTYTYVWESGDRTAFDRKYNSYGKEIKKAILFMEGSEQYKQWTDKGYAYYAKDGLRRIIKEQEIAVLVLRQKEGDYVIEKLN